MADKRDWIRVAKSILDEIKDEWRQIVFWSVLMILSCWIFAILIMGVGFILNLCSIPILWADKDDDLKEAVTMLPIVFILLLVSIGLCAGQLYLFGNLLPK